MLFWLFFDILNVRDDYVERGQVFVRPASWAVTVAHGTNTHAENDNRRPFRCSSSDQGGSVDFKLIFDCDKAGPRFASCDGRWVRSRLTIFRALRFGGMYDTVRSCTEGKMSREFYSHVRASKVQTFLQIIKSLHSSALDLRMFMQSLVPPSWRNIITSHSTLSPRLPLQSAHPLPLPSPPL
jgi:hypothetical protein